MSDDQDADFNEEETKAEEADNFVEVSTLDEITGAILTPLAIDAIQVHEYFIAFTSAGFTEDQALRLASYVFDGVLTVMMTAEDDDDDFEEI